MVTTSTETATSRLISSLEETLQSLAQLCASAERMRLDSRGNSLGFETLLPAELDRLGAVIRESAAAITRRLKKLAVVEHDAARPLTELWPARVNGGRSDSAEADLISKPDFPADSRSMVATYRATCRALCHALREARQVTDTTTTVLLSRVLQRLEKQLWLLDSSRDRPRVGLPLINLFLSC